MRRFKPYTLGLSFSILFHIPFVYFYLHGAKSDLKPDILVEPIVVQCSIATEQSPALLHRFRVPPMSQPPRSF